ncbi:MAG TPA: 23S rRNA (adenine(2503)-C(2))-methyltransferase RlmN [Candidatus Limnocylindria bacterium]|nr:23S rRNA (adenine(2503)-C(2))-methyltransferase RlmN [Candidatus Limnocylindria bacterium]
MELLGKSKDELREFCAALGEPAFRGAQIYHALYSERKFDVAQITNLPAVLRERLSKEVRITLPEVKQRFASTDGSVRYLFGLGAAGEQKEFNTEDTEGAENAEKSAREKASSLSKPASAEAVFMPSEGRQTICVSTQAGCAVDCHFCLTAQLGLIRNLTAGEILAQVLLPLDEHKAQLAPQTNIVLMGQGEPLLNFEPVMAAVRIMLDPEGLGISAKHVTLSTSGIVPGIERLAQEKVRPKLAISLNASNDEQRDALMPINKKYPLSVLMNACKEYPLRTWEHLTFEYVMLGGVNDAAQDARHVVRLLAPLKSVKVNLIPWNPGELPYRESSPERIEEFRRILVERGVPTFARYSRGRDVMAACGQLALLQIDSSLVIRGQSAVKKKEHQPTG